MNTAVDNDTVAQGPLGLNGSHDFNISMIKHQGESLDKDSREKGRLESPRAPFLGPKDSLDAMNGEQQRI